MRPIYILTVSFKNGFSGLELWVLFSLNLPRLHSAHCGAEGDISDENALRASVHPPNLRVEPFRPPLASTDALGYTLNYFPGLSFRLGGGTVSKLETLLKMPKEPVKEGLSHRNLGIYLRGIPPGPVGRRFFTYA